MRIEALMPKKKVENGINRQTFFKCINSTNTMAHIQADIAILTQCAKWADAVKFYGGHKHANLQTHIPFK